ncbi:MAG: acyltransferase [Proteobacteria bacterium]|nr:MAG: acyltransferase [Pseudomonadota bacterium]
MLCDSDIVRNSLDSNDSATGSNPNFHPKYRPDIDGLRAIAVISVLFFHAFPKNLPGGFVGVDIFFVISGFLISNILFGSVEKDRFSFADFYIRRARRIFPALILMTTAVLVTGWFISTASEYLTLGKHAFASTFFVQNLNLLQESGYFDISGDKKPFQHLWSLAVEEQFYIVWPIAVLALFKRAPKALFGFIIGTAVLSFGWNLFKTSTDASAAFYQLQSRFWEMMLGGLLAYLSRHDLSRSGKFTIFDNKSVKIQNTFSFAAILAITYALTKFNGKTAFPGFAATLPVFAAFALIATPRSWFNRNVLSLKPMVWIGLISYPLYLWHWPILSFARITIPEIVFKQKVGNEVLWVCLLLSFVLSVLTYLIIESPVKKMKCQHACARTAYALTAMFLLIGSTGLFVYLREGFPHRPAADLTDYAKYNHESLVPKDNLKDCGKKLKLPEVQLCRTTATDPLTPDVVLIGDSHAEQMAGALANHYEEKGRSLHLLESGDTLGLVDTAVIAPKNLIPIEKTRSLQPAFDWAIKNKAKTVILISRGPNYFEGVGYGEDTRRLEIVDLENRSIKNPEVVYESGLNDTLTELQAAGIETIFFFDNVEMAFTPEVACFPRRFSPIASKRVWPCAVTYSQFLERQKDYREMAKRVLAKFPAVKTFDPNEQLCDGKACYAVKDGALLFVDYNHLNLYAAETLINYYDF